MPPKSVESCPENFEIDPSVEDQSLIEESQDLVPENDLAVLGLKNQIDKLSEEKTQKPWKPSVYSTNTQEGEVSFTAKELDKKDKNGKAKAVNNNSWWVLPCQADGNPRWVCSLSDCSDWRQ